MQRCALVIVTFKRQELLKRLLDSVVALNPAPWRVYVVDNENSPQTKELVAAAAQASTAQIPAVQATSKSRSFDVTPEFIYLPQSSNTGGSGGFYQGTKQAFRDGAQTIWVMDDDVEVMPNAIKILHDHLEQYPQAQVIQGQREDFDRGLFFWQYRMNTKLGIYNPFVSSHWDPAERFKRCNVMCFEGAFFTRELVEKVGLPDPRFFIYWDDALYGYRASKVCEIHLIPEVVLRRSREVANRELGKVRQLNSTSNMTRFYITRNRGHIARMYRHFGDLHRCSFGLGTLATFAKEWIRLVLVDRKDFKAGTAQLWRGWREARRIYRSSTWQAMPYPLTSKNLDEVPST